MLFFWHFMSRAGDIYRLWNTNCKIYLGQMYQQREALSNHGNLSRNYNVFSAGSLCRIILLPSLCSRKWELSHVRALSNKLPAKILSCRDGSMHCSYLEVNLTIWKTLWHMVYISSLFSGFVLIKHCQSSLETGGQWLITSKSMSHVRACFSTCTLLVMSDLAGWLKETGNIKGIFKSVHTM